jgi:hypothetical protein
MIDVLTDARCNELVKLHNEKNDIRSDLQNLLDKFWEKCVNDPALPFDESNFNQLKTLFRIMSYTADLSSSDFNSQIWTSYVTRAQLLRSIFNKDTACALLAESGKVNVDNPIPKNTLDADNFAHKSGLTSLTPDQNLLVIKEIVPLCAFCINSMKSEPFKNRPENIQGRFCLIRNMEFETSECNQFEKNITVEMENG